MKSIEQKGIDYAIEMNDKCDGFSEKIFFKKGGEG